MKAYVGIMKARLKTFLQYRAAAFAGFLTQLFWGVLRISIMTTFIRADEAGSPMNLAQTVSYIWLGQAFLGLLPWNADRDVAAMVREGTLGYDLLRPLDFYSHWFARALGWRCGVTLLRSVILLSFTLIVLPLLGLDAWKLVLPNSLLRLGLWLVSLAMAMALSAGITVLINLSLIWFISSRGPGNIMTSIINICSGLIIPLPFFPEAMQKVFRLLPFRFLSDVHSRIFAGDIPLNQVPAELARELIWLLLLVAAGRVLTARARVRIEVQGG